MAQSPSTGATALATSDLIIRIDPHFVCRYYGTSAQLVAEGLIPDGLKWPPGRNRINFSDARFNYWLERNRVPGTKGPMSEWCNGDYWVLDSAPHGQGKSWNDHEILIKQREIADLRRRRSPEWEALFYRAYQARQDAKYMAFRTQMIGDMAPPRKRGRPAKSNQPTQSQGASA